MHSRTVWVTSLVAGASLLALAGGVAFAELDEEQKKIETGLLEFQSDVVAGKESGSRVAYYFDQAPEKCYELIEQGKALGIKPSQEMWGNPDKYLFKRASAKCDEYKLWKQLVEAADYLKAAQSGFGITKHIAVGEVTGEWANQYGKTGADCLVEIDKRIAAGLPTDIEVSIEGEKLTIAAARTNYCQGLVDWAAKFSVATDAKRADEAAAVSAKYTKHGVKGDKLKLLIEGDHGGWYVKGCNGYVTDPKQLAKAKLLIWWSELPYGAGHALHKYKFKGNKLLKHEYREFSTQEAAYRWCK